MMLWITLPKEDYKKSLKIPKRLSESVYRRTYNAMAKRKSTTQTVRASN
jgi:hypothetical protein